MKYELCPDVALVTICNEHFLVAASEARGKVPHLLGVTAPGAYFWGLLERHLPVADIIRQAAKDYREQPKQHSTNLPIVCKSKAISQCLMKMYDI